MLDNMKHSAILLGEAERTAVREAIEEVCSFRQYNLRAINVRTNHFHTVVSAQRKPEFIANTFKSYATRELRRRRLIDLDTTPWARGRSRRYLWKDEQVLAALDYVLYCQGDVTFDQWLSKYV